MGGQDRETIRADEPLIFAAPPVKNTFVHYDVKCVQQLEQDELRRHQTAPPTAGGDDSDEEGDMNQPVTAPAMAFAKEEIPMPASLCRHSTHDAWEDGQYWDYGHVGHVNEMQVLPENLPTWDGQSGQSGGVLPMTSDTVMLVGVHPPVFVPADNNYMAQFPMAFMAEQSPHWQNWQEPYYEPVPDASAALQSMVGLGGEDDGRERFWDGLGVELLHQPQKIGRSYNMDHVYWVVDASKLNDKAKVLVSPEFKVDGHGTQFSFKMVMYPKDRTSFRAAGGQGFVQLKCESDTQDLERCLLSFRVGICNGRAGEQAKREGPRNAVTWDFKRSLVCDDEEVKQTWNFKDVVDAKTRTFAVVIEILSVEA